MLLLEKLKVFYEKSSLCFFLFHKPFMHLGEMKTRLTIVHTVPALTESLKQFLVSTTASVSQSLVK